MIPYKQKGISRFFDHNYASYVTFYSLQNLRKTRAIKYRKTPKMVKLEESRSSFLRVLRLYYLTIFNKASRTARWELRCLPGIPGHLSPPRHFPDP